MKAAILPIFVLLALCLTAKGEQAESYKINFATGLVRENIEIASDSGKLLFIECYASWHEPCTTMQKEVFTTKEVSEFMNQNFICMSLDMEKISTTKEPVEGLSIARKYNISAYPTYLILGTKGVELGRFIGASSPTEFISEVKRVLETDLKLTPTITFF